MLILADALGSIGWIAAAYILGVATLPVIKVIRKKS